MINKYTESYFLHSLCAVLCTLHYRFEFGVSEEKREPLDKRKVRSELQLCEFALR